VPSWGPRPDGGHTSVSFTLGRYGDLYPDSFLMLRDRLDALHSSAQGREAEVIDDRAAAARPQHAVSAARSTLATL
jgi:hypothetical protein